MSKQGHIIGAEIGGSNLRVGMFDAHGKCLHRFKMSSDAQEGGDKVFANLLAAFDRLLDESNTPKASVKAIGLGCPGPIDTKRGLVRFAPNIPGWLEFPIVNEIRKKWDVPVCLENDAHVIAYGEHYEGVAQGMKNWVLLTLGTGIGSAVFIDGKLYTGATGQGCEIGHMTVNPFGRGCGCGNIGCLEAHCSTTAVVARTKGLLKAGKRSTLAKAEGKLTFNVIAHAALEGDALAQDVIKDAANYLGIAVVSLLNIFNPEAVVFYGGMCQVMSLMMPQIQDEVDRRALISASEHAQILEGKLEDWAGIIGAARWTLATSGISAS